MLRNWLLLRLGAAVLLCGSAGALGALSMPMPAAAAEKVKKSPRKAASAKGRVTNLPRFRNEIPNPAGGETKTDAPRDTAQKPEGSSSPKAASVKPESRSESKPEKKNPDKQAETKPSDSKAAESKPAESKPAESKPTERKPAEEDPAEKKEPERKRAAKPVRNPRTVALSADLAATPLVRRLLRQFRRAHGIRLKRTARPAGDIRALMAKGAIAVALTGKGAGVPPLEKGQTRFTPVFYVDLYLIGPPKDPADIKGMVSLPDAMAEILRSQSNFLAAETGSGLSELEALVWKEVGETPDPTDNPWYRRSQKAQTPAQRLAAAARQQAYVIVDRATWIAYVARQGKRRRLTVLVRDDPRLQLVYGVLLPAREARISPAARRLQEWLTGETAARIINKLTIGGSKPYLAEQGLRR